MKLGVAPEAENYCLQLFRKNWKLILILLLGFPFYVRALGYGFVYDDHSQILANWRIQHLEYLPGYFTQHLWAHVNPAQQGNYYRPLFLVWLLGNFILFGAKAWGWHLTTLVVQICTTFAVYRLGIHLALNERVALFSAAIFLLHPLAIQPTIWISDVDDSLCLFLMICTFISYLKAHERRDARWLVASFLLLIAALLMKETAFVLLAIIPCHAILFEKNASLIARLKSAIQRTIPYVALFLVYLIVRSHILGTALQPKLKASLSSSFLAAPSVLWLYTRNVLVPNRLAVFYDLPYVTVPSWSQFWLPLLLLVILIIALVALCLYRQSTAQNFGMFWMAIVMVPPLAAIPFFGNVGLVHDRYFYPAIPGLALVLSIHVDRLIQYRAMLGRTLAVVVLSYLAILNWQQQGFWRNNELLYARCLAVSPGASKASLGIAWQRIQSRKYNEASRLIEDAIQREPNNYDAYFARFVMKEQLNDIGGAEADARKALEIRPDSAQAHAMIANALFLQGKELEGRTELLKAIELFPENVSYHLDLGDSYRRQKDLDSALKEYRTALSILPHDHGLRDFVSEIEREVTSARSSAK